MGRMKRILCFAMVICITIGFSISTALVSSAEVVTWRNYSIPSECSYITLTNRANSSQKTVFTPGTGAYYSGPDDIVVDGTYGNSYHVNFKTEYPMCLDAVYGLSSVESITYRLFFEWESYGDPEVFDDRVGFFFYINDISVPSSSHLRESYYYSSVRSVDFYGSVCEVSLTVNTASLNLNGTEKLTVSMNAIYNLDGDSFYEEPPFGEFRIVDQYINVNYIQKEYDDVQNEKLDDLNNAITGGADNYDGASSDVESGSSDVINDASDMFSEMENFEHSWQDSVQGIYDALPDAKNPYDSLQGGLIVQRADGTIISQLWDLIEEHREISIFFTAGLLIVCVYFFLRR